MSTEAMFLKVKALCKHPGLSGLTPVSSTVTGLSPGVGAVLQEIIVCIINHGPFNKCLVEEFVAKF